MSRPRLQHLHIPNTPGAMASHQLAIAKASFSAGLLRPDPTSVPRDEIFTFHTALDRALSHCTPANIQTCKTWLLNLVVSSSNRVGGLAKYLVALSGSFDDSEKPGGGRPRPSGKRKRLHILYLLNDLFHHTKFHLDSTASFSTLSGSIQPFIVELLGYAASYDRAKNPKHHRRLDELLDIWEQNGYYGSDYVNKLREVVKNSALSGPVKASVDVETSNLDFAKKQPGKDAPFVMPATHGDASTPFYDLPAGNLFPHIIPSVTVPLRPDSIKPLQFLAGPADEKLVTALKVFLSDAERIYDASKPEPKEDQIVDIDELGQTVIRDGPTGDIVAGSTYYGWSRGFCQEMKKRDTSSSFRSRSRSRSRSDTPRRRRYSDSLASDDSRWSRSRSRSRTPPRRQGHYDSRSRSPSGRGSGSRERSYSPQPPAPRSVPPPPSLPQQPPFQHTQQHPHGYAPLTSHLPHHRKCTSLHQQEALQLDFHPAYHQASPLRRHHQTTRVHGRLHRFRATGERRGEEDRVRFRHRSRRRAHSSLRCIWEDRDSRCLRGSITSRRRMRGEGGDNMGIRLRDGGGSDV
ncbi:hypothetical protein P168DRAFT_327900 [Aspergillus campestris IBT 28561]|uniref:CID domain-containing protein n=1 Tax=Aspergillus campestris (strain IBT 28561) TaxID=1392248 RepID=A0A2I1D1W6_ASPC2|nr:uncharacterized protein P168DRAFT_327900 [Aspergillus campestris IBT 28561]PKY03870.1 hypothetical protein P168DRAFT_327900 [Aspergillus campestris IBT 28561]